MARPSTLRQPVDALESGRRGGQGGASAQVRRHDSAGGRELGVGQRAHQAVPPLLGCNREEWRLQPHHLPQVLARVVLAMHLHVHAGTRHACACTIDMHAHAPSAHVFAFVWWRRATSATVRATSSAKTSLTRSISRARSSTLTTSSTTIGENATRGGARVQHACSEALLYMTSLSGSLVNTHVYRFKVFLALKVKRRLTQRAAGGTCGSRAERGGRALQQHQPHQPRGTFQRPYAKEQRLSLSTA